MGMQSASDILSIIIGDMDSGGRTWRVIVEVEARLVHHLLGEPDLI